MAKDDPLRRYKAKRDFRITAEPAEGGDSLPGALQFVVQKHWASRLHYDFRLELDGTMKSWAVPKGPSYDPADKRMAVHVEDHPMAYNRFEGTIPAKQYGAGKVVIWDKGTWVPLEDPRRGYREGKLKFELRGHKLRGHWTLVRMKGRGDEKQEAWLLIKEKDALARPAAEFSVVDEMPDSVARLGAPKDVDPPEGAAAAAADRPAATPSERAQRPPEGARKTPLPARHAAQLATLVDAPPDDADAWDYEIKFDGYRLLARLDHGKVSLHTRNGHDWTHKLPALAGSLAQGLARAGLTTAWLDGEIVVPGEDGRPDFQKLQNAFDAQRTGAIVYYVFDLPYCEGHDLSAVAIQTRRAILREALRRAGFASGGNPGSDGAAGSVRFSETFGADARDVVRSACALGLEGVIGKRRDSPYVQRRSRDWIKLKCGLRQEFVIGGWTDPRGSRTGLGSLLLGVHDASGGLRYAGNVGTGFSEKTLRTLRQALDAVATDRSPFADVTGLERQAHWVRPTLVAEVAFGEWTDTGRIRHPVFHGLRGDKPAGSIVREKPDTHALHTPHAPHRRQPRQAHNDRPAAPRKETPMPASATLPPKLKVTHPERVIDERGGITKIDLVRFYALVAPLMMPHLKDRPVALVRAPDGVGGELFFQKHIDVARIPGLRQLDPALDPSHPPGVEIAAPEGLPGAAQFNVVELHTWNAVKTRIDRPDRMTFDLDPGEGVGWAQMQEAAVLVRTLLDELGLPAFLKTSGGKGLHVVVPLKRLNGWDTVKDFSQAIVAHLARTVPQRFVAKSGPKNRVGKIFVDYLRNGFGATTVCAWSARARPGMGVSVPLTWEELASVPASDRWTVKNIHERLDVGNAPWDAYEKSRAPLAAAMSKLGFRP